MTAIQIKRQGLYSEMANSFSAFPNAFPRPEKHVPKGVLALDINERQIVAGNSEIEYRFETAVEKALHYKRLAENLQRKYSAPQYKAWTRKGIRKRIRHFYGKAKNIIEDWVKKVSYTIVKQAKEQQYAIAREDLTDLIENLRKLPKDHKVGLLTLSYRKLEFWDIEHLSGLWQ